MPIRRVVTGFDAAGAPTVLFDGAAPGEMQFPPAVGGSAVDLWCSEVVPVDTTSTDDPTDGTPFELMPAGALFRIIELEPGEHAPLWHTTATVDFNYVAAGEATVLLGDDGAVVEEITLSAGDTLVHRGPRHAWVNRGPEVCRLVSACVAATLPEGVHPG